MLVVALCVLGAAYFFGGTLLARAVLWAARARLPPSVTLQVSAIAVSLQLLAWARGGAKAAMQIEVRGLSVATVIAPRSSSPPLPPSDKAKGDISATPFAEGSTGYSNASWLVDMVFLLFRLVEVRLTRSKCKVITSSTSAPDSDSGSIGTTSTALLEFFLDAVTLSPNHGTNRREEKRFALSIEGIRVAHRGIASLVCSRITVEGAFSKGKLDLVDFTVLESNADVIDGAIVCETKGKLTGSVRVIQLPARAAKAYLLCGDIITPLRTAISLHSEKRKGLSVALEISTSNLKLDNVVVGGATSKSTDDDGDGSVDCNLGHMRIFMQNGENSHGANEVSTLERDVLTISGTTVKASLINARRIKLLSIQAEQPVLHVCDLTLCCGHAAMNDIESLTHILKTSLSHDQSLINDSRDANGVDSLAHLIEAIDVQVDAFQAEIEMSEYATFYVRVQHACMIISQTTKELSLSHVSVLSCLKGDIFLPTKQAELLTCSSIEVSKAPSTSLRVVSISDLALTIRIGTVLDVLEKLVISHNTLFELKKTCISSSSSSSLPSSSLVSSSSTSTSFPAKSALRKRQKDSMHCTLTNVSVRLQLVASPKLTLCADFKNISVVRHKLSTKMPARIEIEDFSLSMVRRHAGLLKLASFPLISLEESKRVRQADDKAAQETREDSVLFVNISGESSVEIPNRAELGKCLNVLLLQIAAFKTGAKHLLATYVRNISREAPGLAAQKAKLSAQSRLRVQCSSLRVAIGENANASDCALYIEVDRLSLRLTRISDKETLEKTLCDLDSSSYTPLGHGFSFMIGAMCSASLHRLSVSLGAKTFPVELVSMSGVSINSNKSGALVLAELKPLISQCTNHDVFLPSHLRPCKKEAVPPLKMSVSRGGVPIKVYHDLNVVASEVRVGHGVVLNHAMEALSEALDHLIPPPPPPSSFAEAATAVVAEKLSWWDNLRYMTHGKLALTAGHLAVHLYGPSGAQLDGDHLKIACEDAQIILAGKQKATIRLYNTRVGILPLLKVCSNPMLDATAPDDVLRLPSLIFEAEWKWSCIEGHDPNDHYIQLHTDIPPSRRDKFAHFRSLGLALSLSFRIGANSLVSLNWSRWPWILEFLEMYIQTPDRFQAHNGPARKSLTYPMCSLNINVISGGALSLLWCNSEAPSDSSANNGTRRLGIFGVVNHVCSHISLSKEASTFNALCLEATSVSSERGEFTICDPAPEKNDLDCDPQMRGFTIPPHRKLMTIASFELGLGKDTKSLCFIRGAQIIFTVFARDHLEAIILSVVDSKEEGKEEDGDGVRDGTLVASEDRASGDEAEDIAGLTPLAAGRTTYRRYKTRKSTLKGSNADLLSVLVGRVERSREDDSCSLKDGTRTSGDGIGVSIGNNRTSDASHSASTLEERSRSNSGASTPRARDRNSSTNSIGSSNISSRDSMDGVQMKESEVDFEITFTDVQVQFCSDRTLQAMQTPVVLAAKTARLRQSPTSLQVNAEAVVGFAMDTDAFLTPVQVRSAMKTPIHSRGGRNGSLAHRVLDTPSLVVTSHSLEQTLTILVPELKASTSPDELTAIVTAVTKVILAPPSFSPEGSRDACEMKAPQFASSATSRDAMPRGKEEQNTLTDEDVRVAAQAYAESTATRHGASRPRVLVNTITYRLRSLDLRLCPRGAEEFEINLYDFRGAHHQFLDSLGPGEEYEISVADLAMQNLKPSMVEMDSFEDPMSIFEAVLEDRSHALYRRKETMFRITACTQDVSKMQGVKIYEQFEAAFFPGATGIIHMQITSNVANKLMDFVLGAGKSDEDIVASIDAEDDDTEALLGKQRITRKSKNDPIRSDSDMPGIGVDGGNQKRYREKSQGSKEDEEEEVPMFVQRFRMGETTMMLTSRGFGIQLPDKWRVRVKALQMNNVVTSWDKLTRVILKHFSTKVAKSLVLKNGAKVILSSLTGKIVKASGSAARDLKAEDEVEDAALLFGAV